MQLASAALGLGATRHEDADDGSAGGASGVGRKGISCERTFRPLSGRGELEGVARQLVAHLARDMAQEGGVHGWRLGLCIRVHAQVVRVSCMCTWWKQASCGRVYCTAAIAMRSLYHTLFMAIGCELRGLYGSGPATLLFCSATKTIGDYGICVSWAAHCLHRSMCARVRHNGTSVPV